MMYFRTETHEYRSKDKGWQERALGTKEWKNVPSNLWNKLYALRKTILQNHRPQLVEHVRVKIGKRYDEQTKKTNKFAYKYGVPLYNIITR